MARKPLPPEPDVYEDAFAEEEEEEEEEPTPQTFSAPPGTYGQVQGYAFQQPQQAPIYRGGPPPAVAHAPKDARQFRVQWLDNGRPQDLGTIDVRATVHNIVQKWRKSGTFWLFPLDMKQEPCRGSEQKPEVIDISPEHEAFAQLANAGQVGGFGGYGGNGGGMVQQPIDFASMLGQMQAMMELQAQRFESQIADARAAAVDAERRASAAVEKVSEERLAMAVTTRQDTTGLYEKLAEATKETQEQATSTLITQMQLMAAQAEASAERERMRLEAASKMERERAEDQRRWEREQAAAQVKDRESAYRERMREDDAWRKARQEQQEQLWERSRQADREYHANVVTLIEKTHQAANPIESVKSVATLLGSTAAALGIDVSDGGFMEIVKKIFGGGAGGWSDVAKELALEGMKTAIEWKRLEAGVGGAEEDDDPMMLVTFPDGTKHQMRESEVQALQAQIEAQHQQQQQLPGPANPPPVQPNVAIAGANPDAFSRSPVADLPEAVQPGVAPTPNPHLQRPQQQQDMSPQPAPPPTNPAAKLAPAAQKAARRAVRELVALMAVHPPDAWEAALVGPVQAHMPALGPYIACVGLTAALKEAEATPEMIARVVALLSPHLPPGVPR